MLESFEQQRVGCFEFIRLGIDGNIRLNADAFKLDAVP